jgi:hypothetical protein
MFHLTQSYEAEWGGKLHLLGDPGPQVHVPEKRLHTYLSRATLCSDRGR